MRQMFRVMADLHSFLNASLGPEEPRVRGQATVERL